MSSDERKILAALIATIADPVGNWDWAWKQICNLAGVNANVYKPPFKPHPFFNAAAPEPIQVVAK